MTTMFTPVELEALCEALHVAYEAAALEHGWSTQQSSRVSWAHVPVANKATMRVAVAALFPALADGGYLVLTREAAQDALEVLVSAQAQWGQDYLWHKWCHDEEAPRAISALRAALAS